MSRKTKTATRCCPRRTQFLSFRFVLPTSVRQPWSVGQVLMVKVQFLFISLFLALFLLFYAETNLNSSVEQTLEFAVWGRRSNWTNNLFHWPGLLICGCEKRRAVVNCRTHGAHGCNGWTPVPLTDTIFNLYITEAIPLLFTVTENHHHPLYCQFLIVIRIWLGTLLWAGLLEHSLWLVFDESI